MQYFSIKNWDELQHYKDRTPPWIKLYNHLLDDYEFECLQDASKLHLVLIWLLASRSNNRLPYDERWIKKRIGVDGDVDLSALESAGFIVVEASNDAGLHKPMQDASKMQSNCKQVAIPEESRGEREKEGETEQRESRVSPTAHVDYSVFGMSDNQISELKRIRKKNKGGAITQRVANALAKEFHTAACGGMTFDELLTEWEVRGWKAFKAEWVKPSQQFGQTLTAEQKSQQRAQAIMSISLD